MLVDDNWSFLGSAEHYLSSETRFHVVGCASSGREALEQIPLLKPDLVLMDVAMPHMNGLKTARLVQRLPHRPRLVLMSVNDHTAYRTKAEEIGADGFLPKSRFAAELAPLVSELFQGRFSPR
jgi:DNA-binding NarL/FixJ family response regulator